MPDAADVQLRERLRREQVRVRELRGVVESQAQLSIPCTCRESSRHDLVPALFLRILVWLRRVSAAAGCGLPLMLPARARRGSEVKGGLAACRVGGGRAGRRVSDRVSGP